MPSADPAQQYPGQAMRHVNGVSHEHEREPQLPFYRQHNGTQDGPLSPITVKDFQEHQRPTPRRPSTPNLGRSSPRLRNGVPPPVPDAHQRFKQHPIRDE